MLKIIPAALFFLSFFASLVSNALLRQISKKYNILIDAPDKKRKFHKNPTPLTGGLGISFGIIFSGIFLIFLTQDNMEISFTSENYSAVNQELLNEGGGITHEINMPDDNSIKIKVLNDEKLLVVLPDGTKQIYKISDNGDTSSVIRKEIDENSFSISKFAIGLFSFTILIQLIMLIDDLWGIKEKNKLIIQAIFALCLILLTDVYIKDLGNLFGFGEINIGLFGIPFTIFCVVGMMNAFNYIDGLNGLCASFCLVCLMSIVYFFNAFNNPSFLPLVLPVGAIVGFLMYNLGIFGDKRNVFLGDNGSQALGFLCLWILVYFSQYDEYNFAPVTAMWLVSILFMDALRVLTTRALNGLRGEDLFKARRDHIHHKLQDYGLSNEVIYSILILSTGLLSTIGLVLNNIFSENHYYSFYIFVVVWICFHILINKIPKNV